MKYQHNKYIKIILSVIVFLELFYIFVADWEFSDYYFFERLCQNIDRSKTILPKTWTIANESYGPKQINYLFFNYTDYRVELIISNIIYKRRFYNETAANSGFIYLSELRHYSDFYSRPTSSFYRLAPNEKIHCKIKYCAEEDSIKYNCDYLKEINYSEGFWDRGVFSTIVFLYDGQDLYIFTGDSHTEHFDSFLINGIHFSLKEYELYGWFHPDTTVKEYLMLPEKTRSFTQEEIHDIGHILEYNIKDQYDQYFQASSLKEKKELRKRIAEKLKQEYPIR